MILLTLLAAATGSALCLFVSGLLGADISFWESFTRPTGTSSAPSRLPTAMIAAVAAVLVIVLSGAIVAGLSVGAVVYGLPQLIEHRRAGKLELDRIDAMATFASQMAQGFGGGTGLAKTVIEASVHPPEAIRDEVTQLRAQLEASEFSTALESFAFNMGTPYAAKLAANLIAAEQEHATALQQRLIRIADGAQETAAISRLVRRERSQQSFQVKAITVVLGLVVAGVLLTSPEIVEIFSGSLTGELKFAIVAGSALVAWIISERLDENVALEEFTLRTDEVVATVKVGVDGMEQTR